MIQLNLNHGTCPHFSLLTFIDDECHHNEILISIILQAVAFPYFDNAYISRADFTACSVAISEDSFSGKNVIGFSVADMLVIADAAMGFYRDFGVDIGVSHQFFFSQDVGEYHTSFTAPSVMDCFINSFSNHYKSSLSGLIAIA
ncbi:hypothetical protein DSY0773 [Desulfitobacterium hafniense Y51]|uniref:Uncharacterized protein n=1 Tax=Desulfitobacterium hafniense (strain Y51) TaxID=138119 RepID=Q24ZI0_DESHY|nr:hypothetical protein DSY0773 [Desulfitobacterium hafniense Y51]